MQKKKKEVDIFEMILKTTGGDASVAAVPSFVSQNEDWRVDHVEGQLSVDVGATKKEVVVISTIAGADTSKIEVYVQSDLLTIRGFRERPKQLDDLEHIYHEECYWGRFSRTIVLPVEIQGDMAHAEYANGVLTVRIPKRQVEARIPIKIVEE